MIDVKENVTVIDNQLTTADLMAMFNRSGLTIMVWRKSRGLPYIRITGAVRDTIRYDKVAVLRWARKHGKDTTDI